MGGFVLLFGIILCVGSAGGTVWGFVLLFGIILCVGSAGGTVWGVCIVV